LIRPKNIIFTIWQILVIFQYGGSGVENSKQLRAQKICQMQMKNNNDLYGGSRSTVKSRDIILNFFLEFNECLMMIKKINKRSIVILSRPNGPLHLKTTSAEFHSLKNSFHAFVSQNSL